MSRKNRQRSPSKARRGATRNQGQRLIAEQRRLIREILQCSCPVHDKGKPIEPVELDDKPFYLPTAPTALITLHRRLQGSSRQDLLGRLLTDPRMQVAWREIEKRLKARVRPEGRSRRKTPRRVASVKDKPQEEQENADFLSGYREASSEGEIASLYGKFWSKIVYVFVRSGAEHRLHKEKLEKDKPQEAQEKESSHQKKKAEDRALKPRSWMRNRFSNMAQAARELAKVIADGPLDLLAYEYFPADLARWAFKEKNWPQLTLDVRCDRAHRALGGAQWPSMTDLLGELARRAERHAHEEFTTIRLVDRDTSNRELNFFIRHLSSYFREHLGGPMNATLARLASVVFNSDFDKESVRRALRHAPD